MFTQAAGSIPVPFLIILVFWLSAIFVSFTLFAQANLIVMTSLFVCALSFAGAIFLVLELDDPFTGLMGISSSTLRGALLPLKFVSPDRTSQAPGRRCRNTFGSRARCSPRATGRLAFVHLAPDG